MLLCNTTLSTIISIGAIDNRTWLMQKLWMNHSDSAHEQMAKVPIPTKLNETCGNDANWKYLTETDTLEGLVMFHVSHLKCCNCGCGCRIVDPHQTMLFNEQGYLQCWGGIILVNAKIGEHHHCNYLGVG